MIPDGTIVRINVCERKLTEEEYLWIKLLIKSRIKDEKNKDKMDEKNRLKKLGS